MTTPPPEFLAALKPDDLAAATVASSGKLHIVRIVRRVTRDMLRGDPDEATLLRLFDARPLCSARPRYYWRPTHDVDAWSQPQRCYGCFSAWRQLGRPALIGWQKPEEVVVRPDALRLPFGWAEITPQGHPLDLPEKAQDPDPEEKEEVVGSRRQELRRWMRGSRYVRMTRSFVDQRFCVHYGVVGSDAESWAVKGSLNNALQAAVTIMALGGTPSSKTDRKKLTIQEGVMS